MKKKAGAVILLLLTLSVVNSAQDAPPKLTAEQWQADVRFLGDELPIRHRDAFARMKRDEYDAAVKALYDRAPSLSEDEILVGMMRIVGMIKDGHTNLIPLQYFRSGVFPVRLYQFSDGLFVQKAAPEYAEIVGGRVVKIAGMTADEAFKAVSPAAFADNEMGVKAIVPTMLAVPELLAGSKVIADKTKLTLVVEVAGKQKSIELRPTAKLDDLIRATPSSWAHAVSKSSLPLYLKDPANLYWFEYLKDQKIIYVQHNQIANKQDEPVADFYKRVMAFVESNPAEKLVIDLRFNGGGNNTLNGRVVIELIKSKLNQRGKFFVITGRDTFSAAQNLVNQLEKYTNAIFVGEPTAAHPNHYGDSRPFTLPNSKITVRASTLWWQDLDPRDTRFWTAPEIAADLSSEDYRNGRDTALQAVLEYAPNSSLSELIESATVGKDLAEFIPKYKAFKADPRSRYVHSEAPMNTFGYTLLARNRVAHAIEVFKLNTEAYPKSANVYDSLGDAYQAAGRKDETIKSYEKALAIDPTYPSSIENIKKLKGS